MFPGPRVALLQASAAAWAGHAEAGQGQQGEQSQEQQHGRAGVIFTWGNVSRYSLVQKY